MESLACLGLATILAAVDLSQHAHAVVGRAAELAALLREDLVIVTVLDPDPMKKFSLDEERNRISSYHRELTYEHFPKNSVETIPNQRSGGAEYVYRPIGIRIRTNTVSGKTDDAICGLANQLDADLVIVGNRGLGGVGLVLGSVSERVVHKCNRTVMVVKGEYRDKQDLDSLLDSYRTRKAVGTK